MIAILPSRGDVRPAMLNVEFSEPGGIVAIADIINKQCRNMHKISYFQWPETLSGASEAINANIAGASIREPSQLAMAYRLAFPSEKGPSANHLTYSLWSTEELENGYAHIKWMPFMASFSNPSTKAFLGMALLKACRDYGDSWCDEITEEPYGIENILTGLRNALEAAGYEKEADEIEEDTVPSV